MNVYIYTLGCRLNQCESEAIAQSFENEGFSISKKIGKCPIYVVNTCTVTSKAEQKARRMIRLFAQDQSCEVVIVTGCYAQMNKEDIEELSEKVIVVGGDKKASLLTVAKYIKEHSDLDLYDAVRLFCIDNANKTLNPFDFDATNFKFHSRAYLKIQDGCDNNCYYCRVHIARGKSVSLPVEEVVKRAVELEHSGYHEIVLTGVNLTMYNHQSGGIGGLLEALLKALGPDMRLRFSSLEPDHIDPLFLSLIKDKRVQPHFHIPVQSASDVVLKRINRHYSQQQLREIILKVKQARPEAFLACDVIAGLPGETNEEFEVTYNFLKEMNFSQLHVFPFSPRPNTQLFNAKDRICEEVRDQRALRLRNLSEALHKAYIKSQSNKDVEIVLEKQRGEYFNALSANYLKVQIESKPIFKEGAIVEAKFPTLTGEEENIVVTCRG